MPYPVGRYRTDWQSYPVLIRMYHPELNRGVTLTQVPPAADVYLVWQCEVGHDFVATPWEQRMRPDGQRRRSTWCPVCREEATGRERRQIIAAVDARRDGVVARRGVSAVREEGAKRDVKHGGASGRSKGGQEGGPRSRRRSGLPRVAAAGASPAVPFESVTVGDAFVSANAPRPASAAEPELRHRLAACLDVDLDVARGAANAIRVAQPFHGSLEVWPDIILNQLRVVIEYDTTGRFGLEHVGPRESSDRRKDALLRNVGWEVVRVRCGGLQPIGPYDVTASGVTDRAVQSVIEALRRIRGDLIVDSYLRRAS